MTIAVLCPSKGRPEWAARAYDTFQKATLGDAELWFVLDATDPKSHDYAHRGLPSIMHPEVGGQSYVTRTNDALTSPVIAAADAVGWIGDDMVFRTKGWDLRVEDELGSVPIVYCNDLFQEHRKASSVFMRRDMVNALGWLCPPWSRHLYVDDAWVRLTERLGGRYLPDVVIEHLHPYIGKAQWDEQYRSYNNPDFDAHDQRAYLHWLDHELNSDVERVKAACAT
jgi:hypothetical protein